MTETSGIYVVLDTTAMVSDPFCSGVAWSVLADAHSTWGVRVVVSDVSLIEAIAGYRRRLDDASVGLDRWSAKHSGLSLQNDATKMHAALEKLSEDYPERLSRSLREVGAQVLSVPDVPHLTLVERATARIRPCDANGNGYRDTLNWMLILALVSGDVAARLYWVSANSKDFADSDEAGLHPQLLLELKDVGADHRVTWWANLGDAVLAVAQGYAPEAQSLRDLHGHVRDETLIAFVSGSVLGSLIGQSVSPRRCALPLGSKTATVIGVGKATSLEWAPRGAVEPDSTVVEFKVNADALFSITMQPWASADDSMSIITEEAGQVTGTLLKTVEMRGLLTLDKWDRPRRGDVSGVEALPDDPRREEWSAYGDALQGRLAGLAKLAIPPEMLEGLGKVAFPPDLFKGLSEIAIPPDMFKGLSEIAIPPDMFKGLTEKIALPPEMLEGLGKVAFPPDLFKGLTKIAIPPDMFKGLGRIATPGSVCLSEPGEPTIPDPSSDDPRASPESSGEDMGPPGVDDPGQEPEPDEQP